MHKQIALLVLLVLVVSCSSVSSVKYPQKTPMFEHASRATVAFVALREDGKHHVFCSGAWVSSNQLITNSHCMEGAAKIQSTDTLVVNPLGITVKYSVESEIVGVGEEPKATHDAKSVRVDADNDLALLETVGDVPKHDVAVLAKATPGIGSTVYNVGHPGGLYFTASTGIVSAYRDQLPHDDRKLHYLQISAPLWMGCSGSAVWNEQGELIGIAEAVSQSVPLATFCVPLDVVQEFLHPAPKKKQMQDTSDIP